MFIPMQTFSFIEEQHQHQSLHRKWFESGHRPKPQNSSVLCDAYMTFKRVKCGTFWKLLWSWIESSKKATFFFLANMWHLMVHCIACWTGISSQGSDASKKDWYFGLSQAKRLQNRVVWPTRGTLTIRRRQWRRPWFRKFWGRRFRWGNNSRYAFDCALGPFQLYALYRIDHSEKIYT